VRGLGRLKLTSIGLMDYISASKLSDTLLINGFWRSGTTWLQQTFVDAMDAKSLFEPFSPSAGHRWGQLSTRANTASQNVYVPLSANCLTARDRIKLNLAFKGVGTHGYTHFLRKEDSRTWSRNLVVKSTRLGFILDEISDQYQVPVVHIRRNPAAIFASFKDTDWAWRFQDFRLSQNYSIEDFTKGTREYDRADILLRYDKTPVERLAALWSLSERSAQKSFVTGRAHLVRYEDLVLVAQGPSILNKLNIASVNFASNDAASPVTTLGREKLTPFERQNDWQTRLSRPEIECIRSIANDLFPENGYFQTDNSPFGEVVVDIR
jgi:hypothetical protein